MHGPKNVKFITKVMLSKQPQDLYDITLMLYVRSWTSDDRWRDRPKHVECCSKITKNELLCI
jgi:hypothetical protein